ncbi:hypothetical protein [Butyrivibrio sp. LC3010]|uniref:hypothetical protein n=1 Tax=Butyrivibrio sp. LC3010 TaxID=1280680 RepID=UPI00041D5699|nr:hypothetical protein [Butyrivibrio sp. LC3010]
MSRFFEGRIFVKRFLCILLSMIFLLCIPVSVKAESNDEEVITKQINTFMKAVKNYNPIKMDKCFKKPQRIYVTNAELRKLIKKMHKDTVYNITSINVSGKKAVVTIDYEYYSADDITYMALQDSLNTYLRTKKFDFNKIIKFIKKYYKDDCELHDDGMPTYCPTIKIQMEKVKGKWKIKKCSKRLYNMTNHDIFATMDYLLSGTLNESSIFTLNEAA